MSEVAGPEVSEAQVLGLVADLCAADTALTPIGACALAALHLGISSDSRAISRIFGIAHALVLREVAALAERGLLAITERNPRTQRTSIDLTETSRVLLGPGRLGPAASRDD